MFENRPKTVAFIHIPKCAGSTMVDVLNRVGLNWWHVPYGIYAPEYVGLVGTAETSLHRNHDAIASGQYDVIFGHYAVRDVIRGLGAKHSLRFATVLRDPVERMISDYYYSISSASGAPEWTLCLFPTIRDFVMNNTETEVMCSYLEEFRGEAPERIAERVLNDVAFIGLTDWFADAIPAFAGLFQRQIDDLFEPRNVTVGKPAAIDPDLVDIILARNARDIRLFDLVGAEIVARGGPCLVNPGDRAVPVPSLPSG